MMALRRLNSSGGGVSAVILAALFGGATVARAEAPIPWKYTSFDAPPADADAAHWFAVFQDQLEVALRGQAFAAHFTIDRAGGRERIELAVYYASRMCRDMTTPAPVAVAKCPARLLRYRDGARVSADQIIDLCVVHVGARPPPPDDKGWNAAQSTIRVADGKTFVVASAVIGGQLVPQCTLSIALPGSG